MENITDEADVVVQRFHEEKLKEFVPVIVCLSLLSFCGIVGNIFTIGFYGFHSKWTPTVLMITALAAVDMFICAILVHAITEIGINVHYTNRVTCKLFHVLVHWAMGASALILWLVSIDRYRRICRPLQKQIDITMAKKFVLGVVAFACLLSIRDFVNFDIIEFELNGTSNATLALGHYCTTTDNPNLKISVTIFLSIDAVFIVMVIVTLVVTYGNIVRTIWKSGRSSPNEASSNTGKRCYEDNKIGPTVSKSSINVITNDGLAETTKVAGCNSGTKDDADLQTEKKEATNTKFKSHLKRSEISITLLMLFVSIGFFLCFVPYFIIKIGIRSVKRASDLELGAGTQLAIRLVYVNSFLNPLIYCAFNPQFRKYVKEILSRCRVGSKYQMESSSEVAMSTGSEPLSSE